VRAKGEADTSLIVDLSGEVSLIGNLNLRP